MIRSTDSWLQPVGDYTEAAWWSTLEIHIGIICACLPALRQLLISLGATILGSSKNNSESSKGYSRSKSAGLKNSKTGSSIGNAQATPKRGDEGDFVPLVEYPGDKAFDKGSSYSVGTSQAHSSGSA